MHSAILTFTHYSLCFNALLISRKRYFLFKSLSRENENIFILIHRVCTIDNFSVLFILISVLISVMKIFILTRIYRSSKYFLARPCSGHKSNLRCVRMKYLSYDYQLQRVHQEKISYSNEGIKKAHRKTTIERLYESAFDLKSILLKNYHFLWYCWFMFAIVFCKL